ncbi:unnamed protein product, partial [Rotaria sp. Silwood2]
NTMLTKKEIEELIDNQYTYAYDEQEQLSSSSSSISKKIRTFNDDLFSDEDIINKDGDIFIDHNEQE